MPSTLFYKNTMMCPQDESNLDEITRAWEFSGADLVKQNRSSRKKKDLYSDKTDATFKGNRATLLCGSQESKIGTSSVNYIQADLAVDMAAQIHQSGLPGRDLRRPSIAIITPYAAPLSDLSISTQQYPCEFTVLGPTQVYLLQTDTRLSVLTLSSYTLNGKPCSPMKTENEKRQNPTSPFLQQLSLQQPSLRQPSLWQPSSSADLLVSVLKCGNLSSNLLFLRTLAEPRQTHIST